MPARRRPFMNWLMVVALALVAAFTTYHIVRSVRDFVFWHRHADEPIEPWMTIGFVAHSYHVPPPMLHEALHLPPPRDHRPLARIAAAQGISYEAIRARLYHAIAVARSPHPPPPPADRPLP